jgi:hypothetical protein
VRLGGPAAEPVYLRPCSRGRAGIVHGPVHWARLCGVPRRPSSSLTRPAESRRASAPMRRSSTSGIVPSRGVCGVRRRLWTFPPPGCAPARPYQNTCSCRAVPGCALGPTVTQCDRAAPLRRPDENAPRGWACRM